jgi:hypothetical protein
MPTLLVSGRPALTNHTVMVQRAQGERERERERESESERERERETVHLHVLTWLTHNSVLSSVIRCNYDTIFRR